MDGPLMGNCWTYALPKWWKRPRDTYLIVRLSRHTFWPHVFFCESLENTEVEEFKPLEPQRGWRAWFGAIVFRGRVRKGRGEE
jgi:hypothetical protein